MFKNKKPIEKTVTITLKVFDREDSDDLIKQDIESELDCCWHSLEIKNIEIYTPSFPGVVGERAEMLVDGVWRKGKIVKGYRFNDGIVTIETDDGKRFWCGQSRTDCYRPCEKTKRAEF